MSYTDFSARDAVAVTPHDTNPNPASAIYVGGAGAVAVVVYGSSASVVFAAVPVGTILPVRVSKILSTGTTATNLIALS